MNRNKAKLKFRPNSFEIIEKGDYVVCAVSGKNIPLSELTYWNVDLQEAYYSPKEVKIRFEETKKNRLVDLYTWKCRYRGNSREYQN